MASRVYRLLDTLDLEEGYEKRFPCPDCNSGDPDLGIKVLMGKLSGIAFGARPRVQSI